MQNTAFCLKKQALLAGLNDQQLDLLSTQLTIKTYNPNEILIHENEKSNTLFFIFDGLVNVLKWDEKQEKQFAISSLNSNTAFGEMSFIDNSVRSTTICAKEKTTVGILSQTLLENNPAMNQDIYQQLLKNIAKLSAERLRNTNQQHVQSIKNELKTSKLRNEFGRFFIIVIICFGVGDAVNEYLKKHIVNVGSNTFAWSYLILLLLPIVFLVIRFRYPLTSFGVTLHRWQASLVDGVLFSFILIVLYLGAFWLGAKIFHYPLPGYFMTLNNPRLFRFLTLNYYFHSYIQEFIARGVIQSSLQRFFDDKRGLKSVLITSAIFGMFHLHINVMIAFITFFASIIFGLIYLRTRNLIGVSLVHGTLGLTTMYLGLM